MQYLVMLLYLFVYLNNDNKSSSNHDRALEYIRPYHSFHSTLCYVIVCNQYNFIT